MQITKVCGANVTGRTGAPPSSISPDGRKAVFICDWNLWVRDLTTNQDRQLTTDGEKNFGYAQAVQVDRTLYISSSVAVDAQGRLVAPGDLKGQLQAAYQNLAATLRAHGASFDHVVREDIFTTDMEQLLAVSDLRFDYYSKDGLPAGTWVEVERLVDPGFLVAISATAELP